MKSTLFVKLTLSCVLLALVVLTGCGPKVTRTVDVSNGEYYSAEEFPNLSTQQRDSYCADLDAELASLGKSATGVASETKGVQGDVSSVQGDLRKLQSRYDSSKAGVDAVQEEIEYFEGLPREHTVVSGEFLQKISEYESIYADPLKWPRIYRANKEKLEDPNLIFPDQVLTIPRDWPTSWTVNQDEFLSKIAGYWEVYGSPTDWTKIYEANKDLVKDPDMIWTSWELQIPRN